MTSFMGLKLDCLTMGQSLIRCEELIQSRNTQHVVINAAKVVSALENEALRKVINSCDLVNADGMSVVWSARILGIKVPERVAGIDLMYELVRLSAAKGFSIFLLGAEAETVKTVADEFASQGAKVVGHRDGFWDSSEEAQLVDDIATLAPDILFLAIPSPHKEFFLARHLSNLNVGLAMGVGGSFDVVAGLTRRAPRIMQVTGLEWMFRLSQEPRRMFKRYLIGNSKFVWLTAKALMKNIFEKARGSK